MSTPRRSAVLLPTLLALSACTPGNPDVEDTGPDDPGWTCDGDEDGVIEDGEMDAAIGARATYLANAMGTPVDVDVDGQDQDGVPTWDFTAGPDAVEASFTVTDPTGAWWSGTFPDATFASPFYVWSPDILGIFQQDADGLSMLGLASTVEDPADGQTLLVYDPPVLLYRFPLEVGTTWTVETGFSDATLLGVPNQGQETWEFVVERSGTVLLPGMAIEDVLQLRLDTTQTWAVSANGNTWTTIQYYFVRECLGELGRMVSQPNEADPRFSVASEWRRLAVD